MMFYIGIGIGVAIGVVFMLVMQSVLSRKNQHKMIIQDFKRLSLYRALMNDKYGYGVEITDGLGKPHTLKGVNIYGANVEGYSYSWNRFIVKFPEYEHEVRALGDQEYIQQMTAKTEYDRILKEAEKEIAALNTTN